MKGLGELEYRDPVTQFISDHSFCIPLGEMVFFVLLISGCLLMRKEKLGLLTAYSFVFYWGFIFNNDYFIDALGATSSGLYVYSLMGVLMLGMCVVGFFSDKKITELSIFKQEERKPRSLIIKTGK